MDITIVVPIYNEEANIALLVTEISSVMNKMEESYELLLINDGSTDNSFTEMKKAKVAIPQIKIIDFKRNFGQTPAIMAGFNNALGNIIITIDGDLQNDPRDIPMLVEKINSGSDLVCGWRKNRKDVFLFRKVPSKIANCILAKVLKTHIHDYGCTLKAYRRDILENLKLYGDMHRFIPAIASWQGANIAEIEVNHKARLYGKTKYGINRTIKVILDIFLLIFMAEFGTKPIRFFGGIGLISAGLGIISTITLIYMKVMKGIDITGDPLLILSVLFFLVSVQLISIGFLGEINMRTYYESSGKKTYVIRDIIE